MRAGLTGKPPSSAWRLEVFLLAECFDQFSQSNIDLAFGQETLTLVVYRFIQGGSTDTRPIG
jgi:hypothetical protein